ncbi:transcription initiation factor TFIID subunit TSM1/127kD, putative [Talaromyces stipitatus ATCC 10500]|uniref:Transcription initiation factor TFIID subunit 2 n=1 Tax=Talaromyces stipitatus (strain ATCC 10500 / CBS 375.48 / QM 6759 / NRRL 1006) TaxID=441959 RepID=B8MF48_TALSN|nr:transcription initiation factor TFIID subunit TSM1/127kD, putative [Talaromyces stipitatus ATCC 10500]EED16147.1 transcription initiation factor TFIID subunit TSM1/127kD, putative [Talaromyces stipitatus ATCC 10500]
MPGIVETPTATSAAPAWSTRDFTVAHQNLELEVDFATKSVKGKTEITIHPHHREFRVIKLNFRQGQIKRVNINGKAATAIKYTDPYSTLNLYGVQYHQRLSDEVEKLLSSPPEPELLITIPKTLKIEELDPFSLDAQDRLALRSSIGNPDDGDGPSVKPAETSLPRYTALNVSIEFTVDNVRDGLQFVGVDSDDRRYPHAYTTNSTGPGAGSCLFPCVDDPLVRCPWDVTIKCPCSLNAVFERKVPEISKSPATHKVRPGATLSDDDSTLDMTVVCSGDTTDEIVDPKDSSRKSVSFSSVSNISAQQIGFAVGPFEHVNLSQFRESDQDEQLGDNAVPVDAYCLPGRTNEVKNTCFPIAKAIDYFSVTYGSYPYSGYSLCFVDDAACDTVSTASLSICSNRLLFPENIIDPIYDSTRSLVYALASQWIGVSLIPRTQADTWVTVGMAYYITDTFMKKLCGNNEYRFRIKQMSDRVCELDFERPALFDMGNILKLDPSEMEFVALKAPLILFILERRLVKISGKPTLSRIIGRLLLNNRMGDLTNGSVYTQGFIKLCERFGHCKLEVFFNQWVFGAGCPRFTATQRFNKKKLVVEIMIKQSQGEPQPPKNLEKSSFLRDMKEEIRSIYAAPVQPIFTGSMTIRIHEADGTPYEHIVEIKEAVTKFEVPYNTKYKRLKRNKRQKERVTLNAGADSTAESQDDVLLYCLGDVLQTEEDMQEWRLSDWSKEEEERMGQESYEWIRMDADFEWICKMSLVMPGYMYLSQLQQDRDVVAQLESMQYMAIQKPHPLISTIFVRTLMDKRYFHGIRTAAAYALVKHAKEELDWLGLYHLERAFQELFCLPGTHVTRDNDFSDHASYILQKVIPEAISRIRDNNGKTPLRVKQFLFDKLRFSDNSNNEYSDNFYIASLMASLVNALEGRIAETPSQDDMEFDMDKELERQAEDKLEQDVIAEIDRYRRMDEWSSSFQNIYSRTALHCQLQLTKARIMDLDLIHFLQYTRAGTFDMLRIDAFECLVELDIFKTPELLRWFIFNMSSDSSAWVRQQLHCLFGRALATVAFGTDQTVTESTQSEGVIIEQESTTDVRRANLARKQTMSGALEALKQELAQNTTLKEALWAASNSSCVGTLEISNYADLCRVLYDAKTSVPVRLKYPRYWKCQRIEGGLMRFYKSNRYRVSLGPAKDANGTTVAGAKRKREETGMPPPGPRITFKQSKSSVDIHNISKVPSMPTPTPPPAPQPEQRKVTKLRIPSFIAMPPPAPISQSPATTPSTPGGLKLKLKLGGQK